MSAVDLQYTLSELAAMPDRLEAAFRSVPSVRRVWLPDQWDGIPGERFSALGQICHVRDIEIDGYHVRLQRMLSEANPDLVSIDSYALAVERDYEVADAEQVLAAFRAARQTTVRMLNGVTGDQWNRRGTFAEYGEVTLRSLIHYLVSHDHQHLACLDWLMGKISAERRDE